MVSVGVSETFVENMTKLEVSGDESTVILFPMGLGCPALLSFGVTECEL